MNTIEAAAYMDKILNGLVTTEELIQIFERIKQEGPISVEELTGFIESAQKYSLKISPNKKTDENILDTCGTGGDGYNTFNISTAAAIVCAAAGVKVAKHGNRSASGKCGSADVLEALGIELDLSPDNAVKMLSQTNFAFLFARSYNPAFKHVAEARKEFGERTFFNILGPLLNPARAKYQLIGVADPKYIEITGQALLNSGSERVVIVRGKEGLDEISTAGDTDVYEYFSGSTQHKHYTINPTQFGLKLHSLKEIIGGEIDENIEIMKNVLSGNGSDAQASALIINSGAALYAVEKSNSIQEGVELASKLIQNGSVRTKLNEIIRYL